MIRRIHIKNTATFGQSPEKMDDLTEINFIYGSNGTGKTTISRIIANAAAYPDCTVTWRGGITLETLVYNRDFVERNFNQPDELNGIFTLILQGTSKNASWMVKDDRIGHSHRFGGKINSAFRGISPLGNGDSAVKEDIWYAPSHTAYAQPTIPRRCNPTKRRML